MIFLVDAQLPQELARRLAAGGHDARHTLELPRGNRTPDVELVQVADREGRVLVTKDSDFVNSFLLRGVPRKLLLVSTGNVSNAALMKLVIPSAPRIVVAFQQSDFLELGVHGLIVHG